MEKVNPKEHRARMQKRRLAIIFYIAVMSLCVSVVASAKSTTFEVVLAMIVALSSILYIYIYIKEKQRV